MKPGGGREVGWEGVAIASPKLANNLCDHRETRFIDASFVIELSTDIDGWELDDVEQSGRFLATQVFKSS